MFDTNFIIKCDFCHKEELDTGERDAQSANYLAEIGEWEVTRPQSWNRRTIHICPKCRSEGKNA